MELRRRFFEFELCDVRSEALRPSSLPVIEVCPASLIPGCTDFGWLLCVMSLFSFFALDLSNRLGINKVVSTSDLALKPSQANHPQLSRNEKFLPL